MPHVSRGARSRSESGFTIVELFAVIALIAVGSAMVVMVAPGLYKRGYADSGSKQVVSVLRHAREEAISKRRNVKVVFDLANNKMTIVRVEYTWSGTPPVATPTDAGEMTTQLEGGVTFLKYGTSYPISGFPTSTLPVTFTAVSGAPTVVFTPEGYATDPTTGNLMDGTIFVGRANDVQTARAVTMTGATALFERWQLNGTTWVPNK